MSNYSDLLRDPKWQKMRLKILERDNFCCQVCFDSESTLHVHHKAYQSGRKPWEYETNLLITLCANCHKNETDNIKSSCELLSKNIKEVFLADDINKIAKSLNNSKLVMPSEVVSTVIEVMFEDLEFQKTVVDFFFDYLVVKHEEVKRGSKKNN